MEPYAYANEAYRIDFDNGNSSHQAERYQDGHLYGDDRNPDHHFHGLEYH